MNLKTISEQAKTLYSTYQIEIVAFGLVVVIISAAILVTYLAAPSAVVVPKADRADANANVLHQESVNSESNANVIRESRIENEKQLIPAKKTLNERKRNYEEVRNAPVSVNNTNLDTRERKLQSDLNNLYPANR